MGKDKRTCKHFADKEPIYNIAVYYCYKNDSNGKRKSKRALASVMAIMNYLDSIPKKNVKKSQGFALDIDDFINKVDALRTAQKVFDKYPYPDVLRKVKSLGYKVDRMINKYYEEKNAEEQRKLLFGDY